jgi:hypothetical protein
LPSGDLFVAGGTAKYDIDASPAHAKYHHFTGTKSAIVFDWQSEVWRPALPMAEGRWYPTCITLADGRVMVLGGHASENSPLHENTLVDIFDPANGSWPARFATNPPLEDTGGLPGKILGVIPYDPMVYYPRLHQLPDGRVFCSTALRVSDARRTRTIEIAGRTTADLGPPPLFGDDPGRPLNIYARSAFTSVLLPLAPPGYDARVLICGQQQPYYFEPRNAFRGWSDAGQRVAPADTIRAYATGVILPDATVLVVGGATSERLPFFAGGTDSSAVHFAERYLPQTGAWEQLAESAIPRVYHSVALLLADGRVWVAGSDHDSDRNRGGIRSDDPTNGDARELRIEVYSPPYLFSVDDQGMAVPAVRPSIGTLLTGAGHDQLLRVPTPDWRDITAAHLVRCGSATHAFNPDQRLIVLPITERADDSVTVRMPPNGAVAPPGYYLLFILNAAGTPSVGRFVRISAEYPLAEVYLGRPLTVTDVPDIPVGADTTTKLATVWDLGTLDVGQTRRALLRCKNVGTGELRIYGPEFSGDFTPTDVPGSPLLGFPDRPKNVEVNIWGSPAQPGGFAELELNFTPGETGSHTGLLWIHTSAPDLAAFAITLRANVTGFAVEVAAAVPPEPAVVKFGQVTVGATAFRYITVRNRGTLDAVVSDLFIAGDTAFTVPPVIPDRLVPAGGTRNFSVAFSPQTVGEEHAVLTVLAESTPAPARFTRRLTIGVDGEGTGARITPFPDHLSFGPQRIRTASSPQTVTLRNEGSGPLHIAGIALTSDWVLSAALPATEIPPGDQIEVGVVFRPGHSGSLAGTLVVDSNAPGAPVTVALDGTGVVAPIAVLAPAALAFGDQPVGTHGLAQTVTLINDGAADLHVTNVSLAGVQAADYQIATDRCSGTAIPPEGRCSVDVVFAPATLGTLSAELRFQDDAAGSPRTIALTGTGSAPRVVTLNPTALSFPGQPLGTRSDPQRITLTNNGADPLTVASVTVTGTAATDFAVEQTCGSAPLPPGDSCVIDVTFQPSAVGLREASIAITGSASSSPQAIPVTGNGIGPVVTFEPPSISFPSQPVGTFSEHVDVLLTNTGNSDVGIAAIAVTGDFRYEHSCGSTLGPGAFCRIRVIFMPAQPGARTGELQVTDSVGTIYSAPLDGVGVSPQLALSSASVMFGEQAVGVASGPQSVRLTNIGTGPLIVTQTQVTGGESGEFIEDIDGCTGSVLYPSESCTISIRFAPTSLGKHGSTLLISTNAQDSPHEIRLTGTGV